MQKTAFTKMHTPHDQLRAQCRAAAEQIVAECTQILDDDLFTDGLAGCGEPLVQLLKRQAVQLLRLCNDSQDGDGARDSEKRVPLLLRRLDDIIDASYAKFYAYLFKELPTCWRQLYTDASILKFALLYMSWAPACGPGPSDRAMAEGNLDAMIKTLDLAIVLAGAAGDHRGRQWVDRAFALLEEVWQASTPAAESLEQRPSKRPKVSEPVWQDTFSSHEPFTPPVTRPVRRVHDISFEDFQTYMTTPEKNNLGPLPLVITGLIADWPALTTRPWRSPSYLLSRTFSGRRLVPVELGRSYVDEGWGQQILPFGEFLTEYITAPAAETTGAGTKRTGYLAQHPLLTRTFTLIPSSFRTFTPPDSFPP